MTEEAVPTTEELTTRVAQAETALLALGRLEFGADPEPEPAPEEEAKVEAEAEADAEDE